MKAFQEAAKSRMPCPTCGTTSVDHYVSSPNAYPETDYVPSLDLLAAVSVAAGVLSVSIFAVMPGLRHSRMLTHLVLIALDHGPTISSSHSTFPRIQ
jgi:hypothetical protein